MAQRELSTGGCCKKAVRLNKGDEGWFFCVCAWLSRCPDHGIVHNGTHD